MKTTTITIKPASFGSVSHGTLRTEDLLSAFLSELEGQILVNGDYFAAPENRAERDRLNALVGEAQDCFAEDGEGIDTDKQDAADELVGELQDALSETFAPPYAYFGSVEGDGADFGFWPIDMDSIKEQVGFVSSKGEDYPPEDYRGEWLHVSDHGNATLYVREDVPASGSVVSKSLRAATVQDREIWSII